jgi:AcrR family transcriptional regulator
MTTDATVPATAPPDDPEVETEPRSARTRRRLLDGALSAIDDRGFHATRVDDIVRHAGVSHGAFYLYFDDKQELFRLLAAEAAEDMIARIAELAVPDPPRGEDLVDWLAGFVEAYRRHGAVIRAWMEDHARDRGLRKVANNAFSRIVADLGQAVDTAGLGPLGPVAFLAMLERFTYFALSRELRDDRDALRSVATVIERGFLTPV